MSNFTRGDIYYVDAYPTVGHEQCPGRPAVIVSNDKNNEHSAVIEVVYLTSQPKTTLPTHVTIRSAPRVSTVLCEQVHSIDTALLISLGLNMGGYSVPEPEPAAPAAPACDAAELIAVKAQLDMMRQLYNDLLQRTI